MLGRIAEEVSPEVGPDRADEGCRGGVAKNIVEHRAPCLVNPFGTSLVNPFGRKVSKALLRMQSRDDSGARPGPRP